MTTEGTHARKELGQLIKNIRDKLSAEGRKFTQEDLSDLLGCSQGKVQKIEAGAVSVAPVTVERIIERTGVGPATADLMRKLAQQTADREPWTNDRSLVPKYARKYLEIELVATEILTWHDMRIPGPLQSEQYMLRQFETAGQLTVTPQMHNRSQRRRVFKQPQLHRYECVLAEEALRRAATGLGRDAARDEIDYLLTLNDPENTEVADERTSVLIVPADANVAYLPMDFSILHFAKDKPLVYIEHVAGAEYLTKAEAVERAHAAWGRVSDAALDREGTRELLGKLREEFENG